MQVHVSHSLSSGALPLHIVRGGGKQCGVPDASRPWGNTTCPELQRRDDLRAHRTHAWRVRPVRQPAKAVAQFRRKEILKSLSTQLLKDSRSNKEPADPQQLHHRPGPGRTGVAAGGAIAAVRAMARERAVCKLASSALSGGKEQKLNDEIAGKEALAIFDGDVSGTATHWRQVRLSPQPSFGMAEEHSNLLWHHDNSREGSQSQETRSVSEEDEDEAISALELHWQISTKEPDPSLFKDKLMRTFRTSGMAGEKLATLVCKLKVPMPGILVADVQGPRATIAELKKLSLWNVRAKMAKAFGIAILPSSLNEDDEGEEEDIEIALQPITRVKRGIFQSIIAETEPGAGRLPSRDSRLPSRDSGAPPGSPSSPSSQTAQDLQELRLGAAKRIQQKWRRSRRLGIQDAHNRLQREMQRLEDIQEQAQQEFRQEIRKSLAFRQALREGLEELQTTPAAVAKASEPEARGEEEVAQPTILWTSSENIKGPSPGQQLRPKPKGSRRSVTIREQEELFAAAPAAPHAAGAQEEERARFAARRDLSRAVLRGVLGAVAQLPRRLTSAELARCVAGHAFRRASEAESARRSSGAGGTASEDEERQEPAQAAEPRPSASPEQEEESPPELDLLSAHLMEILSETRKAREALEAACTRSQSESQLSAAVEEAWAECRAKPQLRRVEEEAGGGPAPASARKNPGSAAADAGGSRHPPGEPSATSRPSSAAPSASAAGTEAEEGLAEMLRGYIAEAQEARNALASASSSFLPETELEVGLRSLISETRQVRAQMEGACSDSRLDTLAAAIQEAASAQQVAISEGLVFRPVPSAPASIVERANSEEAGGFGGCWGVPSEPDREASCISTVVGFETDSMHLVAAGLDEAVQHLVACGADAAVY